MKRGGGLSCCITVLYLLGPLLSIQPVDTRPTEAPFVSLLDLLIARDDIDTTLSLQSQQRIRRSVGSNHFHLTSRTGYKLAIAPDGTVNGTTSEQDPNTELARETIDPKKGTVLLKGVVSGLYLAIDSDGHLIATENRTINNYFIEQIRDDHYFTYQSRAYEDNRWYVGLKRNGEPIRGSRERIRPNQHQPFPNSKMFTLHWITS